MTPRDSRIVSAEPGHEIVLRFDCDRCEGYRWRAVNPGRNVNRAMEAIRRGDDPRDVLEWLEHAAEDLGYLAQHHDDVTKGSGADV